MNDELGIPSRTASMEVLEVLCRSTKAVQEFLISQKTLQKLTEILFSEHDVLV